MPIWLMTASIRSRLVRIWISELTISCLVVCGTEATGRFGSDCTWNSRPLFTRSRVVAS